MTAARRHSLSSHGSSESVRDDDHHEHERDIHRSSTLSSSEDTPVFDRLTIKADDLVVLRHALIEGGALKAKHDVGEFTEGAELLAGESLNLEALHIVGLEDGDDIPRDLHHLALEALAACADMHQDAVFCVRPQWLVQEMADNEKKKRKKHPHRERYRKLKAFFCERCCRRRKWSRQRSLREQYRDCVMSLESRFLKFMFRSAVQEKRYDVFLCSQISDRDDAQWLLHFCEHRSYTVFHDSPCEQARHAQKKHAAHKEQKHDEEDYAESAAASSAGTLSARTKGTATSSGSKSTAGATVPCLDWLKRRQVAIRASHTLIVILSNDCFENSFVIQDCVWAYLNGVPILPICRSGDYVDLAVLRRQLRFVFALGIGIPTAGPAGNPQELAAAIHRAMVKGLLTARYAKRRKKLPRGAVEGMIGACQRLQMICKQGKLDDVDLVAIYDEGAEEEAPEDVDPEDKEEEEKVQEEVEEPDEAEDIESGRLLQESARRAGINVETATLSQLRAAAEAEEEALKAELEAEHEHQTRMDRLSAEHEERVYGIIATLALHGADNQRFTIDGVDALRRVSRHDRGCMTIADFSGIAIIMRCAHTANKSRGKKDKRKGPSRFSRFNKAFGARASRMSSRVMRSGSRLSRMTSSFASDVRGRASNLVGRRLSDSSENVVQKRPRCYCLRRRRRGSESRTSVSSGDTEEGGASSSKAVKFMMDAVSRTSIGTIGTGASRQTFASRASRLSRSVSLYRASTQDVAQQNASIGISEHSLSCLRNLACRSVERKSEILNSGAAMIAVKALKVFSADESDTEGVKKAAAGLLRNLSAEVHRGPPILYKAGVLNLAKEELAGATVTTDTQRHLLATVQNMAAHPDAAINYFKGTDSERWMAICAQVVDFAREEKAAKILQQALSALANLARVRTVESQMAEEANKSAFKLGDGGSLDGRQTLVSFGDGIKTDMEPMVSPEQDDADSQAEDDETKSDAATSELTGGSAVKAAAARAAAAAKAAGAPPKRKSKRKSTKKPKASKKAASKKGAPKKSASKKQSKSSKKSGISAKKEGTDRFSMIKESDASSASDVTFGMTMSKKTTGWGSSIEGSFVGKSKSAAAEKSKKDGKASPMGAMDFGEVGDHDAADEDSESAPAEKELDHDEDSSEDGWGKGSDSSSTEKGWGKDDSSSAEGGESEPDDTDDSDDDSDSDEETLEDEDYGAEEGGEEEEKVIEPIWDTNDAEDEATENSSLPTEGKIFEDSLAAAHQKVPEKVLESMLHLLSEESSEEQSSDSSPLTVAATIAALCNFAQDVDVERAIGVQGGLETVLKTMVAFQNDQVHLQGLRFFLNMSFSHHNQERLVMAGVLPFIFRVLQTHRKPKDAELQEQGCGVLRNLATGPAKQKCQIFRQGATAMLVRTLLLYPDHHGACRQASSAIRILAENAPPVADEVCEGDGMRALIVALRKTGDDQDLTDDVLHAIELVMITPKAQKPFCKAGGHLDVLNAMERFHSESTVLQACRALAGALCVYTEFEEPELTDDEVSDDDAFEEKLRKDNPNITDEQVKKDRETRKRKRKDEAPLRKRPSLRMRLELSEQNAIEKLCKHMETFGDHLDVLEAVFGAIRNLIIDLPGMKLLSHMKPAVGDKAAIILGIVGAYVGKMSNRKGIVRFVALAFTLLASLSLNAEASTMLHRQGAAEKALDWMKEYSSEPAVQTAGCAFLKNFAASLLRIRAELVEAGAVGQLADLLDYYLDNRSVLEEALRALHNFAMADGCGEEAAENRLVRRTFRALDKHIDDAALHHVAFSLLWNISTTNLVASAIYHQDGVRISLEAIERFITVPKVVGSVGGMLRNLLAGEFAELIAEVITSGQSLGHIRDAVAKHPRNPVVAEQLLGCLANIAILKGVHLTILAREMMTQKEVDILLTVLESLSDSAAVQFQGYSLISRLVAYDREMKPVFNVVVPHALQMLVTHRNTPVVDMVEACLEEVG